ncbi:MAG: DHA2 family efflux MFS transporter permease subunit [Deltaproteobacteria bacterium]|nr:DHA2 family efflux MFS transporter permease subunit [Deltaproteobacteria bacterium]
MENWKPKYPPLLIALSVTLATFMEILDTSIANVSLPHIAGNLSSSIEESNWVLTAYLISNAIVLPLSGWLSSLIGRKRFYMMSVTLFTLSSLLCGLAPNLTALIFFRILQGIGGGGLQPSEQAILVDTFPQEKRGMGMAIYGMAVVTAPIIGPTLGGLITDNFNWRWIFLINIPVGIISLFLTQKMIEDPPYLRRIKIKDFKMDYWGLILITLGLGSLQYVLEKGERLDWFNSHSILIFSLIAIVGLASAVSWELRQKEPIVDLRLLKERNFMISTFFMFMLGFVLYASTVLLPYFLQVLLGYTATLAGMVISPGGILTMLLMPVVGILLSKVQARWLVLLGFVLVSLGLLDMAHYNLSIDFATAVHSRMIQAAGLSFLFVPINAMAFAFVPKEKSNNATGIINLFRNTGGSMGIAFGATLLARRAQFHQSQLVENLSPYSLAFNEKLHGIQQFLNSHLGLLSQKAGEQLFYQELMRQSSLMAFLDVFYVLGWAFLCLCPLVFLLKKTKLGGEVVIH